MRDYKNVKAPRKYRAETRKNVNRRVDAGPFRGRKRPGRLKEVLAAVLATAAALALCYGAWEGYRWATTAELFQVAGVDASGGRKAGDRDLREAAALFTGQNIFQVDIAGAAKRLSLNPWVRQVRIERRLPNRISITIAERTARAVFYGANGRWLMDRDGTIIAPAESEAGIAEGLPALAMRDLRAAPGEAVESDALPHAMELLDELALRGGWDLSTLTLKADAPESITVHYDGREYRLGRGNYGEKLRRLGEIVSDMNRRGQDFAYLELRPERQAAAMVVKGSAKGKGSGVKGNAETRRRPR